MTERVAGTWIGLENGEHGPIVDSSGISSSWEMANRSVDESITWSVSADDDSDDDSDVSVSVELLDTLLWKARAYEHLVRVCECAHRVDG